MTAIAEEMLQEQAEVRTQTSEVLLAEVQLVLRQLIIAIAPDQLIMRERRIRRIKAFAEILVRDP